MTKTPATASARKLIRRRETNSFKNPTLHPVLERIYAGRSITNMDELDYRLERLNDPKRLPGLKAAVSMLDDALRSRKKIVFIGDFDADGATSTALGILALRSMGAEQVDYLVPNRFDFGYGLSPEIVDVASAMSPQVLVTVDNGISSVAGVAAAKEAGISVIVTDHHLPGEQLPTADAIVNPNLADSEFPSRSLAGVGVIYYVMIALRSRLREDNWFSDRSEPNLGDLLDLVAVGTIADLVPLDLNNRILVSKGLQRINGGRCRPGIRALLDLAGAEKGAVTATDIGYGVGPRLNAAGRLTDMSLGIECLLSESYDAAMTMSAELDRLNKQRREIESEMRAEAIESANSLQLSGSIGSGLCLYEEHWHQGLVGLIAGRLKDRLNKPVVAFAKAGPRELKGSVRSTEGIHIRDVLARIDALEPGIMIRFGGHSAAAGLSLDVENFARFESAFCREIDRELDGKTETDVILTDGALEPQDISISFARLLNDAGPWGQGFPQPQFDDVFEILDCREVGATGDHLKLKVRQPNSNQVFDAIAFFQAKEHKELEKEARLVYQLEINEYNGTTRPQLVVRYLEGCTETMDRLKADAVPM